MIAAMKIPKKYAIAPKTLLSLDDNGCWTSVGFETSTVFSATEASAFFPAMGLHLD